MKKIITVILAYSLLVIGIAQAQTSNQLHFADAGFSIAPLESPPTAATHQVVLMFLPATDQFSPNVNVMIQPYSGTISEYSDLSLKQFAEGGLKVVQHKFEGKSGVLLEYAGKMKGGELHFYARAVKSGGKVYLATATARETQWDDVSSRLKKCVDSFRPDKQE